MKRFSLIAIAVLLALPGFAQTAGTVLPTPIPEPQFFDQNGVPLNGGFVYTYSSGTTTPQATYTDTTGLTQNANPVVLNSGGFPSNGSTIVGIFLLPSVAYTFCVATSANVQLYCVDGIAGLLPTSSGGAVTQVTATVPFTSSGGSAPNISATLTGNGAAVQTSNATGGTVNGQVCTYDGNGNTGNSSTLLSAIALLASPAFTGNPTAPTQVNTDNSTKLATTNFARTAGILKATTPVTVTNPGSTTTGQSISVPSGFVPTATKVHISYGIRQSVGSVGVNVRVNINGTALNNFPVSGVGDSVVGTVDIAVGSGGTGGMYLSTSGQSGGSQNQVGLYVGTSPTLTGAWTLKTEVTAGNDTIVFDYLSIEVH
jgi:hypothetical protein